MAAVEAPEGTTIEDVLAEARAQIARLTPAQAWAALEEDAILVDMRPLEQRWRDGLIPGADVVDRNVLEWRLDPHGAHRNPELAQLDRRIVLICDEGYQSSLAAATLVRFGLDAGDVAGGVQAWRAAGLPLEPASARTQEAAIGSSGCSATSPGFIARFRRSPGRADTA